MAKTELTQPNPNIETAEFTVILENSKYSLSKGQIESLSTSFEKDRQDMNVDELKAKYSQFL
jgi:hypothetical protein